jgi:hypothetical protein
MMKQVMFLFCLFIFINTFGQRVALMDKKFKQPILFTDSLTVEQVTKVYLPVYVKDFDTLDANLRYLEEMLSKPQRSKMGGFELRSGNTSISVMKVPMAYADRFNIIMKSEGQSITTLFTLSDANFPNSKGLDRIKDMRNYIQKNKSLFTAPYEIHPKIYNVVVITN